MSARPVPDSSRRRAIKPRRPAAAQTTGETLLHALAGAVAHHNRMTDDGLSCPLELVEWLVKDQKMSMRERDKVRRL